jgi:hypothetical protein
MGFGIIFIESVSLTDRPQEFSKIRKLRIIRLVILFIFNAFDYKANV